MDPETVRLFREILATVFLPQELAELVELTLRTPLHALVTLPAPGNEVAFELIGVLERNGWTEAFVRAVYAARPGHPRVAEFCRAHAPYALAEPPTSATLVEAVKAGIGEVRARAGSDADRVREAVAGEARAHLAGLGGQFGRLRRYKALHDGLHELQTKYVRNLPDALRRAREDPDAADALLILLDEMAAEIAGCRDEAAGLPDPADEWLWLKRADESLRRLRAEAAGDAGTSPGSGLALLEGLLRVQPTRINLLLTGVLQELRLDRLREVFRGLGEGAGGPGAVRLAAAVEGLGGLGLRLAETLTGHKAWQRVENQLLQIESELKPGGGGAAVVTFYWEEARGLLTPLLDAEPAAAWSTELRRLADGLTEAVQDPAGAGVANAFRRLRPRAMLQFYLVDKALRKLAGELEEVGRGLGALLAEVGDAGN